MSKIGLPKGKPLTNNVKWAISVAAVFILVTVIGAARFGTTPKSAAVPNAAALTAAAPKSAADFAGFASALKADSLVLEVADDGGFLNITLAGNFTKVGAVSFACLDVKPKLKNYGLEGSMFALYDRTGKVMATGSSRCADIPGYVP